MSRDGILKPLYAVIGVLGRRARGAADPHFDPDFPEVFVDDDLVLSATPAATALLGVRRGDAASPALMRFFGRQGAEAETALADARADGSRQRLLLRRDDGTPYELRIAPRGGILSVVLHDLAFAAADLAGAARREAASERDLVAGTLLESGGLVLWRRKAGGGAVWGGGSIRLAEGRISASEISELIEMRTGGRPGSGALGPMVMRLEAMRGGSVLPISVFETDAAEDSRVGFAVDASAAAAAERSLSRFVQTMTETFAHLTIGLAIFDRNQTLALFNPAIAEMWQQDPVWLAQRPGLREILDRLRSARRVPEMRDYHAWRDRLLALYDDTEQASYEELWNLANGTTIRVLGRPHPHGSLALIFDDVTERMQLERHSRQMVDLIGSTMENLNDGIAVFAPDGALKFVNAAFHGLWDTDPEFVSLDMHISALCAMCARTTVETEVWIRLVTFATGEANRTGWTDRLSLGSGRIFSVRAAPLPDGSTMALFSDVTDSERVSAALRERNEALEAAEQMRSAVLDQISYRLRAPLNSIMGFADLLGEAFGDRLGEEDRSNLAGIQEAAAQLLDTVGTVTELASLQIDPTDGEEGAPPVEDILETTVELLMPRAHGEGVAVDLALEGPIGAYDGSHLNLRQIAFNLLADAIHRCPNAGRVVLSGRRGEDGTLSVATHEIPPPGAEGADLGTVEAASLTLPLLRRVVAAEGGTVALAADAGTGGVLVNARLPERAADRTDAG